jgi:hypothetical protein
VIIVTVLQQGRGVACDHSDGTATGEGCGL